jgi:hypothetical protein
MPRDFLEYFQGGRDSHWKADVFWISDALILVVFVVVDFMTTSLNGGSFGLDLRASMIVRLTIYASGTLINAILAVRMSKWRLRILAITLGLIFAVFGFLDWYVFIFRDGTVLGYWIF